MNMIANKVPFGLLSEEEAMLFIDNKDNLIMMLCDGSWIENTPFKLTNDKTKLYRLKLKVGDYYTFEANGRTLTMPFKKQSDGALHFEDHELITSFPLDTFTHIQPSTQSEINSVKPEFKRGQPVMSIYHTGVNNIARFGKFHGEQVLFLSKDYPEGLSFNQNHKRDYYEFKELSKDQIKQLELEEMKHGKKWNGDGYDEWLTADGLTWNELIEHDVSEIEFNNDGWVKTRNNSAHFTDCIGIDDIELFRLKPQETFVVLPIIWDEGTPRINGKTPWGNHNTVCNYYQGECSRGWVFKEYVNEDENGGAVTMTQLVTFKTNSHDIRHKATHAIFVKVGE